MIRLIVVCVTLLAATAFAHAADSKAALIKRGNYLVNTVLTCGNCHTPKGPLSLWHNLTSFELTFKQRLQ